MYSHLLVPIDGSALSRTAMLSAMEFARDASAKVTVLTVVEPFHIFTVSSEQLETTREGYRQHAKAEAAAVLAVAESEAKHFGIPCDVVQIESDDPYREIIRTAAQRGCDLIAMASHGRRGVAALVLGSVTTKVLTHSKIPVLVFR